MSVDIVSIVTAGLGHSSSVVGLDPATVADEVEAGGALVDGSDATGIELEVGR